MHTKYGNIIHDTVQKYENFGLSQLHKLEKISISYVRDIKVVTNKARRNYLVSEPNYYATNFSSKNLLAIDIKKHRYS